MKAATVKKVVGLVCTEKVSPKNTTSIGPYHASTPQRPRRRREPPPSQLAAAGRRRRKSPRSCLRGMTFGKVV